MKRNTHLSIIGNPNCGKTTLFNALTGANQKIGNWPGVTVDKKTGSFTFQDHTIHITDLPGTYSLSTHDKQQAIDEKIAIDFILQHTHHLIINVVNATNLDRHLFLTTQLFELNVPMIIALNMTDVAQQEGLMIDTETLSQHFHCPVIPIVANKKQGLVALKNAIITPQPSITHQLSYPETLEEAILNLEALFAKNHPSEQSRYLAINLLAGDLYAEQHANTELRQQAIACQQAINTQLNEEVDTLIADTRYRFVNEVVEESTCFTATKRRNFTHWFDKIVVHRFLGIPIFLAVMYCMFLFAINIGGAFQDFFDISSNTIFVQGLAQLLTQLHCPPWLIAILSVGAGKGINTTITFIPVIGGMFLFLSFLEGSGYMTRAAFVMDRLMRAIGLPGKSFVPMIVGFGCNVPAIMATRTLENRRDRILTIMMSPFMSCGARLAIFSVFTAAFFPRGGQNIVFALYLTGIFIAILTGLILRKTFLQGEPAPLIMEMPPYHWPTIRSLLTQTWHRLKRFLMKAGKLIVPICVIIGALNAITFSGQLNLFPDASTENSVLSIVAKHITPVLAPIGVTQSNWPATVGLITGSLAKEVVVGTLNTLYTQMGHLHIISNNPVGFWQGLKAAIASIPNNLMNLGDSFRNPVLASAPEHDINQGALGIMYLAFGGQAAAFAYLLFVLLYVPCVSTVAVTMRELNKRWAMFSVAWSFGIAYGVATGFYQAATFSKHPYTSLQWIIGIVACFLITTLTMRYFAFRRPKSRFKPLQIKSSSKL